MNKLNEKTFIEKVSEINGDFKFKGDKPCVLKFSADWCGPCKVMQKLLDELSTEMTNIDFYEIDVDDNEELTEYFNVQNLPTLFLVNSNGEYKRFSGTMIKNELKQKLEELC